MTVDEMKEKGVELFESVAEADADGEALRFVYRKPTQAQLARYSQLGVQQNNFRAGERLLRDVMVEPCADELDRVLERRPALTIILVGEVLGAAGGATFFERRRL